MAQWKGTVATQDGAGSITVNTDKKVCHYAITSHDADGDGTVTLPDGGGTLQLKGKISVPFTAGSRPRIKHIAFDGIQLAVTTGRFTITYVELVSG